MFGIVLHHLPFVHGIEAELGAIVVDHSQGLLDAICTKGTVSVPRGSRVGPTIMCRASLFPAHLTRLAESKKEGERVGLIHSPPSISACNHSDHVPLKTSRL